DIRALMNLGIRFLHISNINQSSRYSYEQTSEHNEQSIRDIFTNFFGIVSAIVICCIGLALQVCGLYWTARHRLFGAICWIAGVGLGFAGPLGILWGIL